MNTNAIERIKDYCTEVNQEQWNELVKVADEVGVYVGPASRRDGPCARYELAEYYYAISLCRRETNKKLIPFPDFLVKLKGWDGEGDPFTSAETLAMAEKPWQPKAGEMVEVAICGRWFKSELIAFHKGQYVCQMPAHIEYIPYPVTHCRPLRPTITREQAEKELNCRIKD